MNAFSGISLLALVVALIAGVAMAVQGGMNSALGKIIGLLEATFVVHMVAAVISAVMVFALNLGDGNLAKSTSAPWYLWLGGPIGILITYGVVASIPKVGAAVATTAIIIGQVTTAMLIDHYGVFGLERIPLAWPKFVGMGLLAAGARLMLMR